jgi:hypothetical protein
MLIYIVVLTMYMKSGAKTSKHKWTANTDTLGILSYVSTQLFVSIGGTHFSSVACQQLDCATFLHLPATHILFSLAPFDILTQPLPLTTSAFITALGPGPSSLLKTWQSQALEAADAVEALRGILKNS